MKRLRFLMAATMCYGIYGAHAEEGVWFAPDNLPCLGRSTRPSVAIEIRNAAEAYVRSKPEDFKNSEGRLFAVESLGVVRAYVLGTIHYPIAQFSWLPSAAQEALKASSALYLEVDPSDFRIREEVHNKLSMQRSQSTPVSDLLSQMSATSFVNLDMAAASLKVSTQKIRSISAVSLLGALSGASCYTQVKKTNGDPLDILISRLASAFGIKILPLETVSAAFEAVSLPEGADLAQLLESQLRRQSDLSNFVKFQVDSYLKGSLSYMLASMIAWRSTDQDIAIINRVARSLLEKRNENFAETIQKRIVSGEAPAFFAFGASHLIGNAGVLARLQEKGYEIIRLDIEK